jgi:hypothetical protein
MDTGFLVFDGGVKARHLFKSQPVNFLLAGVVVSGYFKALQGL